MSEFLDPYEKLNIYREVVKAADKIKTGTPVNDIMNDTDMALAITLFADLLVKSGLRSLRGIE